MESGEGVGSRFRSVVVGGGGVGGAGGNKVQFCDSWWSKGRMKAVGMGHWETGELILDILSRPALFFLDGYEKSVKDYMYTYYSYVINM